MSANNNQRLEFLDALRGIAAAWVVLYHMVAMSGTGVVAPSWANSWVSTGGMGVTLFFIVSAFSLCLTLPHHTSKPHPLYSFFSHRIFRIAPLFSVWILISMLRDYSVFKVVHEAPKVLSQFFFTFNLVKGWQEGFVWASWTIGVEMLFYLIFPFIVRRFNSTTKTLALFFITLILNTVVQFFLSGFELTNENFFYNSIFRHLPTFVFGMFVFYLWEDLKSRNFGTKAFGLLFIAFGFFLYDSLLGGSVHHLFFRDDYYWQAVLFGAIFLGAAFYPAKVLVNRTTQFLGKISYSLYLAHPTFIFVLSRIYVRIMASDMAMSLKYIACVFITFAALIPFSYVTFRLVEKPGIILGRRLDRWLQDRSPKSAT